MTRADELLRNAELAEARAEYERERRTGDAPHAVLQLAQIALLENRVDDVARELSGVRLVGEDARRRDRILAESCRRRDRFAEAAPFEEAVGQTALAARSPQLAKCDPYAISGTLPASVPFTQVDPLPVLEVRVNDQPATFFLDTGACEIYLDSDFARRVGIPTFGHVNGQFAGGLQAELQVGIADSVELGSIRVTNVPATVKTLDETEQIFGCRMDGILGTIMLYHFLSTIHYADAKIVLEPRDVHASAGASMPFWLAGQHLILAQGRLNGVGPMLFHVDTGMAGGGFLCGPQTLARAGIAVDESRTEEGVGGGGAVRVLPFEAREIALGAVARGPIQGMQMDPFPEAMGGLALSGTISHQFFLPGFLTIDIERMELRVG